MTKSDEYFNAGEQFAEFAESVEIGLADYFVGSYGSYASVAAAKAGLDAVAPARSSSSVLGNGGDGGGDGRVGMMPMVVIEVMEAKGNEEYNMNMTINQIVGLVCVYR